LKALLDDETVLNIDVNDDGGVWVERWGKDAEPEPERMPLAKRRALIMFLASVTGGNAVNRLHSRLQCDMPIYGARVQAMAEPIEGWTLCIRVPVKHVPDLQKYVDDGIMEPWVLDVLDYAVQAELGIVVAGNVNTGKTTLTNATLKQKAKYHSKMRAVVVQDRREVRVDGFQNRKFIMARVPQAHHESNGVVVRYTYEFSDSLEDALRSNGSFLVWSEVRDERSAFALMMASNTGSKGLITTIQAKGVRGIPERFGSLIELDGKRAVGKLIASIADVLVYMDFDPRTKLRRVLQVGVMEETDDGYKVTVIRNIEGLHAYMKREEDRRLALALEGESDGEVA
jgi:Flp pilus assembly CpaF family ATPase